MHRPRVSNCKLLHGRLNWTHSLDLISTGKLPKHIFPFAILQTSCLTLFFKWRTSLPTSFFFKLLWVFFSVWRIFCKNFMQWCWFVLLLKNKMGAKILKRCNQDTWFGSFTVDSFFFFFFFARKFNYIGVPLKRFHDR